MKLKEIHSLPTKVFSLHDLELLSGKSGHRLSVDLNRWIKANEIIRLKAGVYSRRPMAGESWNTYVIAGRLSSPSYVTDLTAMQQYGIPMEGVSVVVSAHLNRPVKYRNKIARFEFRQMAAGRFFGWKEHSAPDGNYWMATPEKAVLDYLYYRRRAWTAEWIEAELRPNISDCSFDKDKFLAWAKDSPPWVLPGALAFMEAAV